MTTTPQPAYDADVIVVGAGPAGSATAFHLAQRGLDVLVAGEDRLPPGEGLRRRPHPPRGEAAHRHGHRHQHRGGLGPQRRPAHHRRRSPPRDGLAGPRHLPELRPDPHPQGLRRDPRAHRAEGRRPADRAHQRHRPGPRRAHRPDRRGLRPVDRRRRLTAARGHLPRAARGRRRRQLEPAVGGRRPRAPREPPDGRRGPHLLPLPRPTRTTSGSRATSSSGTATSCSPATAGSSASATAPSTSASASSTPARPSARSTTRP